MIKIALCDDDQISLALLKEYVEEYLLTRELTAQYCEFNNAHEILMSNTDYDIYISDIIMPYMNGLELGQHLKNHNALAQIIYLSSEKEFAADAFDIDPCGYIVKPLSQEKLFELLDKARKNIKEESFYINTSSGLRRYKKDDLLYVNIVKRSLNYHMKNDEVFAGQVLRTPFAEATSHLQNDPRFIFIKPSLLINLEEIAIMNRDRVTFHNQDILYVPRGAYQSIVNAWQSI